MNNSPQPPIQLLDPQMRRIAMVIGIMLIAAGGIAALTLAWPVVRMIIQTLLPFVVGLIFAYIFNPVVNFVQLRLRLSRVGGVLVLYLLFALGITAFFAVVLPIMISQSISAWRGISGFLIQTFEENAEIAGWSQVVMEWLTQRGIQVDEVLMDAAQNSEVRSAAGSVATGGLRMAGFVFSYLYDSITSIIGTITFWVFALLVNIYLLLDFSKLGDALEVMIPKSRRERALEVLGRVDVALGGYLRGTLITAFLVGLMTFLGLFVLGLGRYALLIGVLAGFGNLIPYLGPVLGAAPALLYVVFGDSFETSQERLMVGGGVLVLAVIIQVVEGFVLQPKVVGKSAQLHPLAVLFALVAGANFGLLGMIVAVPVACVARVLIKEFY